MTSRVENSCGRGPALYYLLCCSVSTTSFLLMGLWQPPGRLAAVLFTCAGLCLTPALWLGVRATRRAGGQAILITDRNTDRDDGEGDPRRL